MDNNGRISKKENLRRMYEQRRGKIWIGKGKNSGKKYVQSVNLAKDITVASNVLIFVLKIGINMRIKARYKTKIAIVEKYVDEEEWRELWRLNYAGKITNLKKICMVREDGIVLEE